MAVKAQVPRVKPVWVGPVRPLDCVITLTFTGQQPSGKNQMGMRPVFSLGGKGKVVTKLHRFPRKPFERWREEMCAQFQQQRAPWAMYFPIHEPVSIFIQYVPADHIGRDVPGLEDALWHAFEHARLVTNDRYFRDVVFVQMPVNRAAPQVQVEIVPSRWRWEVHRSWSSTSRVPETGEFVLPDRGRDEERSAADATDDRRTGRVHRGLGESFYRVGDVSCEFESGISDQS